MKSTKANVVVLTGPIASGKSTVRTLFNDLNVPTVDADKLVHNAYQNPESLMYQTVLKHYGATILDENKFISRPKLKELIHSGEDLKVLQNLLSKLILNELIQWSNQQTASYVLWEVPLYTRSWYSDAHVVVVYVDTERQSEFFHKRGTGNAADLPIIKQNQKSLEEYLAMADDTLDNSKDVTYLKEQVFKVHIKLMDNSHE